ncbi:hypothetical protein LCGC14_1820810 [marine sediment metagenome]|uniref:HTH arsR-type domain-containing protein n=1 Tax=marine sediment metagenome TaxID=412755 RepID=A0A0F9GJ12_9ZZZZ
MEKYVNEIPLLVRNSIKALSDENRQGILIYLLKNNSKSFIEISKDLKMPKNNLSYHFKILIRYGLIYNFYDRNEFAEKYSFYEISKLGKRLITTLMNFIKPTLYMEEVDALFNTDESFISAEGLSYQTSSFIKGLTITAGNDLIGEKVNYKPFSKKEQIVAG